MGSGAAPCVWDGAAPRDGSMRPAYNSPLVPKTTDLDVSSEMRTNETLFKTNRRTQRAVNDRLILSLPAHPGRFLLFVADTIGPMATFDRTFASKIEDGGFFVLRGRRLKNFAVFEEPPIFDEDPSIFEQPLFFDLRCRRSKNPLFSILGAEKRRTPFVNT